MTPRCRHIASSRVARTLVACSVFLLAAASRAEGAGPGSARPAVPTRSKTIVDHAVTPAGGHGCRECGAGACRMHAGHVADCRDGHCAPHCPVRPSQHGFYRTQWRRWPGSDVIPVSAEEAATPVSPPSSQVPTIEEESPPAAESAAATPAAEPSAPDRQPPAEPAPKPAPQRKPAVTPEPAPEPKPSPKPASKPDPAPARDAQRPGTALPTDPIPEDPAAPAEGAKPAPAGGEAAPGAAPPVPPTPPGEPPVPPAKKGEVDDLFDQSGLPDETAGEIVQAGAMRYPSQIGRSVASGETPWRLQPTRRQRPADSARGL